MTAPFRPPLPLGTEPQQSYVEYERRKNEFVMRNPNATPEEYTEAMKRIARECGI